MLKSSLLSDEKNIEAINRDFVPVNILIEKGFPLDVPVPALEPVREAFLSQADYSGFFATVVVIDPTGRCYWATRAARIRRISSRRDATATVDFSRMCSAGSSASAAVRRFKATRS